MRCFAVNWRKKGESSKAAAKDWYKSWRKYLRGRWNNSLTEIRDELRRKGKEGR